MGLPEVFGAAYMHDALTFPKLKMPKIAEVAAMLEKRRAEKCAANASKQKLNPEAAARLLAITEAEEIDLPQVYAWAGSVCGSQDMCERSLVTAGKSAEEAKSLVAEINPQEQQEIALWVVGYLRPKPPAKPEDKQTPNPTGGGDASTGDATAG